jgi:hypothetical protein
MVTQVLVEHATHIRVVVAVGQPDFKQALQVHLWHIVFEVRARHVVHLPQPTRLHQHFAGLLRVA